MMITLGAILLVTLVVLSPLQDCDPALILDPSLDCVHGPVHTVTSLERALAKSLQQTSKAEQQDHYPHNDHECLIGNFACEVSGKWSGNGPADD